MSRGVIAGLIVGVIVFATGLVVLLSSESGRSGPESAAAPQLFAEPSSSPVSVVWAVGDGADGGTNGRAVADLIGSRGGDRVLYLGDVYESGTAEEFETNYRPLFGALHAITMPTMGNHEWENRAEGYYPYWEDAKGVEAPPWYSFSASGWQLISLNSMEPRGKRSEQLRWLRDTVSDPDFGDCRLAFMHHPRHSAGRHGNDQSIEPIWRALQGHATLVLAGHDHNMQRFRPIGGLTQLVAGAGGHGLYSVDESDRRLGFSNDTRYGALRLVLRPDRGAASFISVGGGVLDRFRFRCRQD